MKTLAHILALGIWLLAASTYATSVSGLSLNALQPVETTEFSVRYPRALTTRRSGDYALTIALTNLGIDLLPTDRLFLALVDLAPTDIRLTNSEGLSTEGSHYFEIDPAHFGVDAEYTVTLHFAGVRRQWVDFVPHLYLSPGNATPIADAGPDRRARVSTTVSLDGSGSYDPDGDLIDFAWSPVSSPAGSLAVLDDASLVRPSFVPELPGNYRFALIVTDGQFASAADQVEIQVLPSDGDLPPDAHAGPDQQVRLGDLVMLDGSSSSDPDGLPLTYAWSLSARPNDSLLDDDDIQSADQPLARFQPDAFGLFELELTVDNGRLTDSDRVWIQVSAGNLSPIAAAGPDITVKLGAQAILDGSASRDRDDPSTPLTYRWQLVSKPAGSLVEAAALADSDQPIARLVPDVEGQYVVRLEVSDGELTAADNTLVLADGTPPLVSILDPAEGAVIDSRRPTIRVMLEDTGSGLHPESFRLFIDGGDVTSGALLSAGHALYIPAVLLSGGEHQVTARIADRAGNLAETTQGFTVTAFQPIADCGPTRGKPLTVSFRPRGEFTGGSIVRYSWDRNGDGVIDSNDSLMRERSWTFYESGTFQAKLEVENNFGEVATDTCTIVIESTPPTVIAQADPSNGPAPLLVDLVCIAFNYGAEIVLWEWDLDGDGTYDTRSTTDGDVSHLYETPGDFIARCRATDERGQTTISGVIDTLIRVGQPGTPRVRVFADRDSGPAPLTINFDAFVESDVAIIRYEWDFDGDGVIDHESTTTPVVSHIYEASALYAPTLRVTNATGETSADSVAINVGLGLGLSIQGNTFTPELGETTTVVTTLSNSLTARILINDQAGRTVRRLVYESRDAGTYEDRWDGRDDSGRLLPDGPYYAVMEHDFGGRTEVFDLTWSTGGVRYTPVRNTLPNRFSPYLNSPLEIQFMIPPSRGPSEILAFIGWINVDTRLVTLLERVPMGVGTHTIYWDGVMPDGSFAVRPPDDIYLFALWGYTLPGNAIYLAAAPKITKLSVQPTLFSPERDASESFGVNFDLDKDADVDIRVTSMATGRLLFNRRYRGVTAGTGKQLSWDGMSSLGLLADKGEYRVAVTAIDRAGNTSLTRYLLFRVFY